MQATTAQVLGFPQPRTDVKPAPAARPTPLPKRPKGRWLVGVGLLAVCAIAAYNVWTSYFRYRAYGTVIGRTIEVSPPWDGVVRYQHVREGDSVRQGQPLVTVENTELRQRHAQLGDELRVAQANLEAEAARLKWQSAFGIDQSRGAVASYYEALGHLLREQSRLEELKGNLHRAEMLTSGGRQAISREELDQIRHAKEGSEQTVAKMKQALTELKRRADQADQLLKKDGSLGGGLEETGSDQLKPNLARIEALQAERARLQERLDQGEIRAPTNGIVVKLHRRVGEYCKAGEPALGLLEEGSLQVVLYLPQNSSTLLAVGDEIGLAVEPYPDSVSCTVIRLGDQFEPAPEQIKRHYSEGQKLLPVYMQPRDELARWMALRVGGVTKLSYGASICSPGAP